ncbi:Oidioi.mRNA.OKI2018_I69.PAR.g8861.t1.cds [Oikopleura dioica]|uniref:Oidioi.mRNA.OKI2018_I69.PAR.g8861.t1.cds n=1 Tax=Oikopleura dioica TaxID=34765 RepID=A0ABN7RM80_OIKDI|nr:Oidioi.mRNA.OKI2018_I69.PAR.g8861.t1.cds [Oikopleura dioica]
MASQFIQTALEADKVVVFSKSYCPYCKKAKDALKQANIPFKSYEIENRPDCAAIQAEFRKMTGAQSVPRVFINGKFFGGGDETAAGVNSGKLQKLL